MGDITVIYAKILSHSISHSSIEICTLEIKAPKFLDAEFEKHRMISSNSSSDRAIPFLKMLDKGYYLPDDIRLNQPGMQGDLLLDETDKEEFWNDLKDIYGYTSEKLKQWDKVHKQHLNRYLMGFSWQHKVATATEWTNFFNLRLNKASDPSMYMLASVMEQAMRDSHPVTLQPGEWHLPFLVESSGNLEDDIKCSVARCARVSYLNHDNSTPDINKDIALADKLLEAGHMSPFEHQGKPMGANTMPFYTRWEDGVTHLDRDGQLWSGNLRGFVQWRQML